MVVSKSLASLRLRLSQAKHLSTPAARVERETDLVGWFGDDLDGDGGRKSWRRTESEHGLRRASPSAEHLLDALANAHAGGITGVSRGATVDGGATAVDVLRNMRCHALPAHLGGEIPGLVRLRR